MKKLIALGIALLTFGIGIAQEKNKDHKGFRGGDMFVSGSVGFNSIKHSDDSKEKKFNFNPRYGYFLNDFFAVGGRLGFVYADKNNRDHTKIKEDYTYSFDVFGRYYLLPGSKFSVFGELDLGFGWTRNMEHHWTNGVNATISPGLSYFLGEHFALEAIFGILSYNTVSHGGKSGSTHDFEVGLDMGNINFGIIYKF